MLKRLFSILVLLVAATMTVSGLVWAAGDKATYSLPEAREAFPPIFDKAIKGKLSEVADEAKALQNYPLYPYLEAADLEHQMQQNPRDALDPRIEDFLKRQPEIATYARMRAAWLVSLHVRGKYRKFLEHYGDYQTGSSRDSMRCRHIRSRIALNRKDDLLKDAKAVWLQGKSVHKACDPVFEWLKDEGHMSEKLIRERAVLAMEEGNTGLASWLSKKLPDSEEALFKRWIQVHRNPYSQIKKLAKKKDAKVSAEIIAHGIKRAAHTNTDKTAELTPQLIKDYKLSRAQAADVRRYLGYRYSLSRKPESVDWFAKGGNRGKVDDLMHAWRIRSALFHGDWQKARDWTSNLPKSMAEHREWQYWKARALEATGKKVEARAIYAEVAKDKGYYHYLAADRLKVPYAIKHVPTPENIVTRDKVESLGGVLRTREWLALNDEKRARREWRSLMNLHPDKEMLRHLSALAHRWGWHFEAILTQAKSDYWDDLHLRYPLPHQPLVNSAAKKNSLDPAWIYGIMRSESLFMTDAKSPVGAMGLMQLMPATARIVGKKIGLKIRRNDVVLKPENNIKLGSAYLQELLSDHENHYAMASASYNAGPHRVKRWRPKHGPIDADIWVTNIPFNETRSYVDRVMTHTTAFQWRLGHTITRMSERLPQVHPTKHPNKP